MPSLRNVVQCRLEFPQKLLFLLKSPRLHYNGNLPWPCKVFFLQNVHNISHFQESHEQSKENSKLRHQVESFNDQLNVLQSELSSLTLERDELNKRLSSSSVPNQVCDDVTMTSQVIHYKVLTRSFQPQIQNTMSSVPNPFKRNDDVIKLENDVKGLTAQLEQLNSSLLNKEMQYDVLAGKFSHQETLYKEQISGQKRFIIYIFYFKTEMIQI